MEPDVKNPWEVQTKSLADIQNRLKDWLWNHIPTGYGENNFGMFGYGADKEKIVGRRLLYLCLLFLEHYKQVQLNGIAEIQRLSKRISEQQTSIEELKAELRDYKHIGYVAVVTHVHWNCDDGCCSDSWYEATVLDTDKNPVKEFGGEYTYDKSTVVQEIHDNFGKNIKITFDDRDY